MTELKKCLEGMTREQLIELLEMSAKNLVAMDGVWFQVLEERDGMDRAMEIDAEVWNRFPYSEVKRLKKFLGLGEHPGLEGLEKVLSLNYNTYANESSAHWEGDSLVFRIEKCRVQAARKRKGMEFHPCKFASVNEYGAFANAVDDRIQVECLSCYPEITDQTCSCSWRFTIPSDLSDKAESRE